MPEVSSGVHVQRIYVDTSVFGGYFDPEFEIPTRRSGNDSGRGYPVLEIHTPREVLLNGNGN